MLFFAFSHRAFHWWLRRRDAAGAAKPFTAASRFLKYPLPLPSPSLSLSLSLSLQTIYCCQSLPEIPPPPFPPPSLSLSHNHLLGPAACRCVAENNPSSWNSPLPSQTGAPPRANWVLNGNPSNITQCWLEGQTAFGLNQVIISPPPLSLSLSLFEDCNYFPY